MANTCTWKGKSGTTYTYDVHRMPETFDAVAGNYIFAKVVDSKWHPIYIGESSDLSDRLDNWSTDHHKADCIEEEGATHIHKRLNSGGEKARTDEEQDLLGNYDTPCNG